MNHAQLPLGLKIVYTLMVCVIVVVYWRHYGPRNFLWFSDIALIAAVAALWLESRLIASMMFLAVWLPELAWNLDFFGRLISGRSLIGLSAYMFEARWPLLLRALSLFHVGLPVLLVWLIYRLGYDLRALKAQTLVAWIVFPVSYLLSHPSENINWVFGPGNRPQAWMNPLLYLLLLMVFFPLCVYLPTHLVLQRLFRSR